MFGGKFTEEQCNVTDIVRNVAGKRQTSVSAVTLTWLKVRLRVSRIN